MSRFEEKVSEREREREWVPLFMRVSLKRLKQRRLRPVKESLLLLLLLLNHQYV